MLYCEYCQSELPGEARFCATCGFARSAMADMPTHISHWLEQDGAVNDRSRGPAVPSWMADPEQPDEDDKDITAKQAAISNYESASSFSTDFNTLPSDPSFSGIVSAKMLPSAQHAPTLVRRPRFQSPVTPLPLTAEGAESGLAQPTVWSAFYDDEQATYTPDPLSPAPTQSFAYSSQPTIGWNPAHFPGSASLPTAQPAQKTPVAATRGRWIHRPVAKWLMIGLVVLLIIVSAGFGVILILPPNLSITGSSDVTAGGVLSVHGAGFLPGDSVKLTLDNGAALSLLLPSTSRGALSYTGSVAAQLVAAEQLSSVSTNSTENAIKSNGSGAFDALVVVGANWTLGEHALHANEGLVGRGTQVTFRVVPRPAHLDVNSSFLDFGTLQKGIKVVLVVILKNTGGQRLNWTANSGGTSWLGLHTVTGSLDSAGQPHYMYITADTTHLSVGSYSASVQIHSNGGDVQVGVKLRVVAASGKKQAKLNVNPSNLRFGVLIAGQQTTLVLTVGNLGTQGLHWTAKSGTSSWLKLDRSSGMVNAGGLPQTLNVTADATQLQIGSYSSTLSITSNGGNAIVNVALAVSGRSSPRPPPMLTVSPTSFINGCLLCTVTLAPAANAQNDLVWFASNSGLNGVVFSQTSGILSPGQSTQITISLPNTTCPASSTFTFAGPINSVPVSWSCVASSQQPVLTAFPGSFSNACSSCIVTLAPAAGAQGNLGWRASASGLNGITFSQTTGTLSPGQNIQVTVSVPTTNCPAQATFNFQGPANTVSIPWNCTPTPTPPPPIQLTVSPSNLNPTNCSGGPPLWSCTVTVGETATSPGNVTWYGNDNLAGVSFNPSTGILSPGQTQSVTITNIPCQSDTFSFSGGVALPAYATWNCTSSSANLTVNPTSLDFGTLNQGSSQTLPVMVSNTGGQPLKWSADTGGVGWLSLDVSTGTVQSNSSQTINVTANTTSLSAGSYPTTLTINSNGGSKPITVTLVVVPQPAPQVTIDRTSLDPTVCGADPNTPNDWSCLVSLTESASSLGDVTWSISDNLGVSFRPQSATLSPGNTSQILISTIPCQNDTFTFTFTAGVPSQMVSWTCVPTPTPTMQLSTTNLNGNTDCAYDSTNGWSCSINVISPATNQGDFNWSVSAGAGISFTPSSGILKPGISQPVTIAIPVSVPVCPSTWNLYFHGPMGTLLAQWSCIGPHVSVSPTSFNANTDCSHDASGQNWTCIVTLMSAPTDRGYGKWSAGSPYNQVSFSNAQGTLLPGQQVQIMVTVSNVTCPFTGISFNFGGENIVTVYWSCT